MADQQACVRWLTVFCDGGVQRMLFPPGAVPAELDDPSAPAGPSVPLLPASLRASAGAPSGSPARPFPSARSLSGSLGGTVPGSEQSAVAAVERVVRPAKEEESVMDEVVGMAKEEEAADGEDEDAEGEVDAEGEMEVDVEVDGLGVLDGEGMW